MSPAARASLRGPLAGFLAALFLWSCLGTATDTENGIEPLHVSAKVVDSAGRPVAGLEIHLRPLDAHPDSGPGQVVYSPRTDDRGTTRIRIDSGTYMAEGRLLGMILFLDTLRSEPGNRADTQYFRAQTPRSFQGRVRLKSGYQVDTGVVFLRGTSRFASIRSDGSYDLGLLPPDVVRLSPGIRYRARPANNRHMLLLDPGFLDDTLPALSGRIGVLGAVDSISATCVDDALPMQLSLFVEGSLEDENRLAEIVSNQCPDLAGTLIRVETADTAGNVLDLVGEYVRPDDLVFPRGGPLFRPLSLPTACLYEGLDEDNLIGRLLPEEGELHVDDIRRGQSCW